MKSCGHDSFTDIIMKCPNSILTFIHMAIVRAKIPNQHHADVLFEVEHMWRESQRSEAVDEFQRILVLILQNLVPALVLSGLSW